MKVHYLENLVPNYRQCIKLKDRGFVFPTVFIYVWDNKSPEHKPFLVTRTRASQPIKEPWAVLCAAPLLTELVQWAEENNLSAWKDFWNNKSLVINDFADIVLCNLSG